MSSPERRSQCKAPEPKVQRTVQFSCFVTAEYPMRSQGLGLQIFYCTICRAGKKREPVCPQQPIASLDLDRSLASASNVLATRLICKGSFLPVPILRRGDRLSQSKRANLNRVS